MVLEVVLKDQHLSGRLVVDQAGSGIGILLVVRATSQRNRAHNSGLQCQQQVFHRDQF